VNDLHGHHQIEDGHYFPLLAARDARITRGFDILDRDHQALDGHLEAFVKAANLALSQRADRDRMQDGAGAFRAELARLDRLLDRHLNDEEELVVPVLLRDGTGGLG